MQYIIILLFLLAYLIIGFFLAGITCGIDGGNFLEEPLYLLAAIIWPITLIVLVIFGFVNLGIKLGKKLQKWK